jgi:hypothetical protein
MRKLKKYFSGNHGWLRLPELRTLSLVGPRWAEASEAEFCGSYSLFVPGNCG